MDTELLKTFLEVKETRHFGRAAEHLYLTQAAVSSRIKALEKQIGTPLFTRYRNNLQLTETGEKLVKHAKSILCSWEKAKTDLIVSKQKTQTISLGATSGLWELTLQNILTKIHLTKPDIALKAECYSPEILIRNLMERTIDISLIYEPAKLAELKSIQVSQSELLLVSTQKKQTLEQTIDSSYVSVDWGPLFDINISKVFKEISSPVLQTTLARIALEFILSNGGSAYLPLKMVESHLNKSLFQVDKAPVFRRQIYACYHLENRNTKHIEDILL